VIDLDVKTLEIVRLDGRIEQVLAAAGVDEPARATRLTEPRR